MSTAIRNHTYRRRKERDVEELVSRLGTGLTAGPPLDGGFPGLLEFTEGLRTRCAPGSRTPLPRVCRARRLAGRMVANLGEESPYDAEALEDAFAELRFSR